jgi:hypothetical protein
MGRRDVNPKLVASANESEKHVRDCNGDDGIVRGAGITASVWNYQRSMLIEQEPEIFANIVYERSMIFFIDRWIEPPSEECLVEFGEGEAECNRYRAWPS